MDVPLRIEDWVKTEIAKLLAAIEAAGWDEAKQGSFIRLLIEQGVDELEAAENEHYDFLADCVALASDNMQDARLQALEQRIDALENPPFNLAQTLVEGALIMVGEVIIAGAAYYAVPALFAAVAARRIFRQRERLLLDHSIEYGKAVASISKIEKSILDRTAELEKIGIKTKGKGSIVVQNWADALKLREQGIVAKQEIEQVRDQLRIAKAALKTSEDAANKAAAKFDATNAANVKLQQDTLAAYLTGAIGSTIIGRIGETAGQDFSAVSFGLLAGAEDSPLLPFETSGVVGEFLAAIQTSRRASRQGWSDLRLQVKFLSDTQILSSVLIRDLHVLTAAVRFQTDTPCNFSAQERSVFVQGFEALLWCHWLTYSNLLHVTPFKDVMFNGYLPFSEGDVVDGYVVETSSIAGYLMNQASGDFYSGASSLNEDLAKTLFNKFARPYFRRRPDAIPKLLAINALDGDGRFDTARYDELWKMSKSALVVLDNPDRVRRLDELRVLVIAYFIRHLETLKRIEAEGGAADDIRSLIREMLELSPQQPGPLHEVLEGLPTFDAPGPPALSQAPIDLSALAGALAENGALEQKWLVGDARSQLEAAVSDLDLKVTTYPLLYGASATAFSADRVVADDALGKIEQAKQVVAERHAAFLELAESEPDLAAEVDAQLGDRMRALTNWSPGQIAEGTWKYYPPVETPPMS